MKTILSLIALMAFTIGASAQTYAPVQLTGIPTSLTAATNLATPVVIDVRKQQNVPIQVTVSSSEAHTNSYTFCRSVDGSAYDTNFVLTVHALTGAGTPRTTVTNLVVDGVGYLVLTKITPGGSATITNTVKYGIKTQSP